MQHFTYTQPPPLFSWQSVDKRWRFSTVNYGLSHFQKSWNETNDGEAQIEPITRTITSGMSVVLTPFCKPALWWQKLIKEKESGILPVFFHRGRLFCGPLLERRGSLCPTCVALRLAQGFPHRDVLLSAMANPVLSEHQTILEDMWQVAIGWIKKYEQQLRSGQLVSSGREDQEGELCLHQLLPPPGNHPHHAMLAAYEPIFLGDEVDAIIPFSNALPERRNYRDKYVGPVLLTLPANTFVGEPVHLNGYVTSVGYLGKYTKWASDVTGAGMSFGAEAEQASIGEAIERYSGNFIPDTLIMESEHSLKQQSLSFLSQALFRNLSIFQEDYYAPKLAAVTPEEVVLWVTANPLTEDTEARLVPAEAAYLNLTRSTGMRSHFPVVLAGVAAHQTQEEAEASALLEVIERDATMRWWYAGVPAKRILNIEKHINSIIQPTAPVEQWCLLLASQFAYVVAGCLYDREQQVLTVGFAARQRIDRAILKSLAEAWQLRRLSLDLLDPASSLWADIRRGIFPFPAKAYQEDRAYRKCFRDDFLDMDQLAYNLQFFLDPMTHEEAMKRLDGDPILYTDLPPLCDDHLTLVRQHCLQALQSSNFKIWSVDLTTSDMRTCGFSVVRILCPDLAGNAATAFAPLAHPRLVKAQVGSTLPKFYPLPHA